MIQILKDVFTKDVSLLKRHMYVFTKRFTTKDMFWHIIMTEIEKNLNVLQ